MRKIGILNCSHIINFGSVLQSYATEKVVRDITNKEVYSIRYIQKKDFVYFRNYVPLLREKAIVEFKLKGLKRKIYLKLFNRKLAQKCRQREQYFDRFVSTHFNLSKVYNGKKELQNALPEYDCFVLGSDQVWHPINFGSHYYTMEWIPDNIPKVTYAASFGVSKIPTRQKKGTSKYLSRINEISVREKAGMEIVYELTGRKVEVVIDPTLLLDSKEWNKLCAPIETHNYIFCYFLGDNPKAREYANQIKEQTGLKIYCITFMDEINKIDFEFGDKQLFDVGPSEFIAYIKNAKYVITDSFHGTVFSILFHKQFVAFDRFITNKAGSTNSRIDTLLEQTKLEARKYNDIDIICESIDYELVDMRLASLRELSLQYLKAVLNKNSNN